MASDKKFFIVRTQETMSSTHKLHNAVPYRKATDLVQKCLGHAQRLVLLQAPGLDLLGRHAGEVAVDRQEDPVQVKGLHDGNTSTISSMLPTEQDTPAKIFFACLGQGEHFWIQGGSCRYSP